MHWYFYVGFYSIRVKLINIGLNFLHRITNKRMNEVKQIIFGLVIKKSYLFETLPKANSKYIKFVFLPTDDKKRNFNLLLKMVHEIIVFGIVFINNIY